MNESDSKTKTKTKYPVSVNGYQCIGPCYPANTTARHPITLDEINDEFNFCPTDGHVKQDPKTGKTNVIFSDKCYVPTITKGDNGLYLDEKTIEMTVTPKIKFSSDFFIKIYYNINSLEELLSWLDSHDKDPYRTKERVFNTGMMVYSDNINIIDNRLVKFVDQIMVKNLPQIVRHVKKYFIVSNDTIKLITPNNSENNMTKTQISKLRLYLKEHFFGMNNIQTFLSKMLRYYRDDFKQKELSKIMTNHMIEYIIKKITITLDTQNENSSK